MFDKKNQVLMQYFEWYLPNNIELWNKLKNEASELSRIGIDYIWMPPAYKAANGIDDVAKLIDTLLADNTNTEE